MMKTADGVILDVYVKPESKRCEVESQNDMLVVFCRETPVKGKANRELIKELSKLFRKRIEIASGSASRQKKILIKNINSDEVCKILSACKSAQGH
jgi:hypothetical protein